MTKSEIQTRLDQYEIKEKFGVWADYKLTRRARIVSKQLFKFDEMICGGVDVKMVDGRNINIHYEEVDGEPHLMREYYYQKNGTTYRGIYRDCGKVADVSKLAAKFCEKYTAWFAANGHPEIVAKFGGDIRYIIVTDGKRDYSLID